MSVDAKRGSPRRCSGLGLGHGAGQAGTVHTGGLKRACRRCKECPDSADCTWPAPFGGGAAGRAKSEGKGSEGAKGEERGEGEGKGECRCSSEYAAPWHCTTPDLSDDGAAGGFKGDVRCLGRGRGKGRQSAQPRSNQRRHTTQLPHLPFYPLLVAIVLITRALIKQALLARGAPSLTFWLDKLCPCTVCYCQRQKAFHKPASMTPYLPCTYPAPTVYLPCSYPAPTLGGRNLSSVGLRSEPSTSSMGGGLQRRGSSSIVFVEESLMNVSTWKGSRSNERGSAARVQQSPD